MKNGLPFAALTAAFNIAGGALGYSLHDKPEALVTVLFITAVIGGAAAFFCRIEGPK